MLVLRTSPIVSRLFAKLGYQLVPAAIVTTVGVLLLSNLTKMPDAVPVSAPVETAINAEAVFKIVPRETAEAPAGPTKAAAARAATPKPVAANTAAPQPRKPANETAPPRQTASAPPPLQIVQIPQQPQAPATPSDDNTAMGKLRNATAAVQRIPQWTARSVASWFTADAPPRPPAPIPTQDFQAAM